MLPEKMHTAERNSETLLAASSGLDLEVNAKKPE